MAKRCLIEAAHEELERLNERASVTRIHAMTGVHRKDIGMFSARDRADTPVTRNPLIRVVGLWRTHRDFTTARGAPRVLSVDGPESQFHALVGRTQSDLNPYTTLFELERAGIIERTTRGVRLKDNEYTTQEAHEAYNFLAEEIEDLFSTIEGNVNDGGRSPNLQLKTAFDNIPASFETEIRQWLRDEGSRFQNRIREYLGNFDREMNATLPPEGETIRVACSSFSTITAVPREPLKSEKKE